MSYTSSGFYQSRPLPSLSTTRPPSREFGLSGSSRSTSLQRMNGSIGSGGISSSSSSSSGLSTGLRRLSIDRKGTTGLDNLGNTCYMNSILQCLIHTTELRRFCTSHATSTHINSSSPTKGKLFKSFCKLAEKAWNNEVDVGSALRDFRSQIAKHAPAFAGTSQHDAQEFLVILLEGIHEDINRISKKPYYKDDIPESYSPREKARESWKRYCSREESFIIDHFVGQLKSTLTCKTCGYQSQTYDPYFDLSLPIPRKSATSSSIFNCTLDDCLKEFTSVETLDGYDKPRCEKCKSPQPCTKQFRIEKFPRILVIHLKRFSMRNRYSKLDTKVSFPLTGLSLNEFASEEQQAAVCGGGGGSRSPLSSTTPAPVYNLFAVSNHSGTAFSGHYTAYCKLDTPSASPHAHEKPTWYSFNDRSATEMSETRVPSSSAYVLFYELASSSSSASSNQ